jgi:ProP effector
MRPPDVTTETQLSAIVQMELNQKNREKAKQARDTIAVLADLWPHCFSVSTPRLPLKLGIHRDILAARPGGLSGIRLRRALRHYTNNAAYLQVCFAGSARIDLDGELAGKVTADEAVHAAARLARRKHRRKSNSPTAAPISSEPAKRVTLADLRTSAAARKAGAL